MGVGLEGGTVPVYVAESVARKYRGNLVSLYQFNIALGEVFGYVVAAIFVNVKSGSWRYMLGSSLVFSTIMLAGMIFMPESPRFLMHKGKVLESLAVWKRIRGLDLQENREEFFIMRHAVEDESATKRDQKRFVWLDFFTVPRARRSIVYANIMVFTRTEQIMKFDAMCVCNTTKEGSPDDSYIESPGLASMEHLMLSHQHSPDSALCELLLILSLRLLGGEGAFP